MKSYPKRIGIIVAVAATFTHTLNAAPRSDLAKIMFEAARKEEVVNGELNAAIRQYRAIISEFKNDRATVADALIRMAECYQKMGDAESRKIYEHVVKDFADQKEAVAVARARLGFVPGVGESRMSFRQVHELPKEGAVAGAISRDGRYLPYVDWSANGNLFVHDFMMNTNRRLTDTATDRMPEPKIEQFAVDASISRDARRLAYNWHRGDTKISEVRLLDLSGDGIAQPRLLFKNDEVGWTVPMDWSPDGKTLAVQMVRAGNTKQIGLVSVPDGALRVLKSVDWRGSTMLVFSPDGKYLAYDLPAGDGVDQRDVFVLAVDGSREIPATVSPSQDVVLGWSNDGSRLLFASDRGGSVGLWSIRFAAGKIDELPELLRRDIGELSSLGLTETGKLYSRIPTGPQRNVHVASVDFSTGKLISAPTLAAQTYVGDNQSPAWSRDGKYLAYVSRRRSIGPAHYVFVIRSVATGEVREVSPSPGFNEVESLIWAADGRSLITNRRDVKGRYGIFRVDTQTGVTTVLVEQKKEETPPGLTGISPDGTKLYYSTRTWASDHTGPGESVRVSLEKDLTTGRVRELHWAPTWTIGRGGVLSPDGRHLLGSDPSNPKWLFILPTAGGELRKIALEEGGRGLAWAPEGSAIWRIMQSGDIWRLPIDGSERRKLESKLEAGGPVLGRFRVHPAGQQIAFETRSPAKPQEVWVLENFLPALAANK